MMKCETFMNRFLEKDETGVLTPRMRIHLYRCARCSAEVDAFASAMADMRTFEPFVLDGLESARIIDSVMRQPEYRRSISLFNWVAAGALMFVGMFLAPFSDQFASLRDHFGGDLEVPFSLVMGIMVTIYAAIFIGTHIDDFSRWMEHRK
jgi:hypothetical protein